MNRNPLLTGPAPVNTAVTDLFEVITRQWLASSASPDHDENVHPDAGAAVRQTFVPTG